MATFTIHELLAVRRRLTAAGAAARGGGGDGAAAETDTAACTLAPYGPEELNRRLALLEVELVALAAGGRLPPACWAQCRAPAKRDALLEALRGGHLHVVYAMQPESGIFKDGVSAVEMTPAECNEVLGDLWARGELKQDTLAWLLAHGATARPMLCPPVGAEQGEEEAERAANSAILRGLAMLGKLGGAAASETELVAELLSHSVDRVRRTAAEVLGGMGGECKAQLGAEVECRLVADLAAMLRDGDARVRLAASSALSCFGEAGTAAAAALLAEGDIELVGLAANVLRAAGPAAAAHGVAMARLLDDRNAGLRRLAAEGLGAIGEAAAPHAPALAARLCGDDDEHVREAAALALGGLGGIALPCLETVVGAMDDADTHVREAAMVAFGKIVEAQTTAV
eukprot:NODE_3980_length_1953_cov_3.058050.p1 GENE.NODE_3980_length_1953_cov_3.058050~~NODE_3980_length_1953_cov_3.058050.p1  ORF type:complete len:400 (-),score=132.37 NODE_3980_length_1953_cov_3.058050:423-1622(-)